MENWGTRSEDDDVIQTEDMFKKVLNPIEPLVMRIQSLLVWEYPKKSAVLLVCVHGIFWFFVVSGSEVYTIASTTIFIVYLVLTWKIKIWPKIYRVLAAVGCRFYFVVSTVTYIVYLVQTWKHKIWPEIRVPPAVPEDPDSWTPVHARLLSVPELCTYLAQIWCSSCRVINYWLSFRRAYPFLFCVVSCSFFLALALIGRYIPGLMLSYIIVMSTLLCPSVLYHNLLKRLYLKFEPMFMKMEYSIKLKNKWSFKVPHSSKSVERNNQEDTVETDSETEFTPSLDPVTTAALARAITDSEDESPDPSLATPLLSKEPSIDLEGDEEERQMELEADFEVGIQEMPSFDDVLDHTDDELLDSLTPYRPSKQSRQRPEKMTFVSEHFGDSSDSDDNDVSLTFPSAVDDHGSEMGGIMASVAGAFVSKTISTVVESALSGITNLKQSTTAASTTRGDHSNVPTNVSYRQESGDEIDVHLESHNDTPTRSTETPRQPSMDSSDIDIAEEFEFLDQYDLDDTEK